MQFLKKNLHDMGYGMPRNIPMSDIYDPEKARKLAGQYVDGYSKHHNFETPLMKLVAYNMGQKPQKTGQNLVVVSKNYQQKPKNT